jgi:hypothetical protein
MAAPSLFNILPKDLIEPLKALGRHDWLNWKQSTGDLPRTEFQLRFPDDPLLDPHGRFLEALRQIGRDDAGAVFTMFVHSKLVANGPKVLRPTAEQCEALEHVDVKLSFAEYEQPFPVFLVELPDTYRRGISERLGHPSPNFVTVFHDRPSDYILTICEYGPGRDGTYWVMSPRSCWTTIEDALQLCVEEDGPDLRLGELLSRVALNFALLLTKFGAKNCGPADPQNHAKQKLKAKRSSGKKARRAKELLAATINLIDFEQNVVFTEPSKPKERSVGGHGPMKRPHWRGGHFRQQPCGEGLTERRLIFVKPCFINSEFFQGDRSDTEYRIRSRSTKSAASDELPAVKHIPLDVAGQSSAEAEAKTDHGARSC